MIDGLGTDMIEIDRMEKLLSKGQTYLETIFSVREIAYCESKARKAEHYAARFAAKEAFLKALGTGWLNGMGLSEIEILNDELGKPGIQLHGNALEITNKKQIRHISLSMSHIKDLAIAIVILDK